MTAAAEIKVEKGVPLPTRIFNGEGIDKYPWSSMEVGDSFAVPPDVQRHFATQASAAGKKHRRKFSVRKVGNGYRCWRIA